MPKHGQVSSVLESLNSAQRVSNRIREAQYQSDVGQLKLWLADINAAVAEAKMELSMLQGNIDFKDSELLRLNDILTNRAQLRRRGDAYYKTIDGRPYGQPFCSYCWEKDSQQFHLHNKILSKDIRQCPNCKNEYQAHRTPFFDADKMPV